MKPCVDVALSRHMCEQEFLSHGLLPTIESNDEEKSIHFGFESCNVTVIT